MLQPAVPILELFHPAEFRDARPRILLLSTIKRDLRDLHLPDGLLDRRPAFYLTQGKKDLRFRELLLHLELLSKCPILSKKIASGMDQDTGFRSYIYLPGWPESRAH